MAEQLGLIHIYCGDGKGKTTASIGLAVRAAGRGYKVIILQFLKGMVTGELSSLALIPNIKVVRGKDPAVFTFKMSDEQKLEVTQQHNAALKSVIESCKNGEADLLILDEIIGSYDKNLVDRQMLIEFLDSKPKNLEVAMTGRNPHPELLSRADYVSEIKKIKHPYDSGTKARIGVER